MVDNFYGPGKLLDITRYVKKGENSVEFEAKQLGADYNKHEGDSKAALVLKVVGGSRVVQDFKPADVVLSYARNAAEEESFDNTLHFTAK